MPVYRDGVLYIGDFSINKRRANVIVRHAEEIKSLAESKTQHKIVFPGMMTITHQLACEIAPHIPYIRSIFN